MSYTDAVSRTDAGPLITESVAADIIQGVEEKSVALSMMRQARMSTKQHRMPILAALPQAYFVNGDTGLKQTTKLAWANKFLIAEEIAVIVPIPDAVVDDADYDIWGQLKPKIIEAFALKLDLAILFGIDKPSTWGAAVAPSAVAAGNVLQRGTVGGQDLAGDISAVMGMVETDGFDVSGHVARKALRHSLRNLRDDNGQPIFTPGIPNVSPDSVWGEKISYIAADGWVNAQADLITGDWMQAIVATRQDLTYKVLTEATLFDENGQPLYNLAQQDMSALRIVGRFAYEQANPINRDNSNNSTRSPFAVLQPA